MNERARLEDERNPAAPDDDDPWEIVALEFLDALIEAATQPGGLGGDDYDAPIGRDVDRVNTPWIGELKATGVMRKQEGGRREYRVYFGEPDMERALLAALLGFKTSREMNTHVAGSRRPTSSAKQTSQVVAAMGIVQRWCRQNGVEFRTIGT